MPSPRSALAVVPCLGALAFAGCCAPGSAGLEGMGPPPSSVVVIGSPPPPASPGAAAPSAASPSPSPSSSPAAIAASAEGSPPPAASEATPGRPLHLETQEALLGLFTVRALSEKELKRRGDPQIFLAKTIGPDTPARANQGNPAMAHHAVSREACMAGLVALTIQTPEQRAACGGAENMVPIYAHGDVSKAKTCIDVFEFPNRACELPFVWISPTQASVLCELEGKRLCVQEEWIKACRGDPEGKDDWIYAYGNELDLEVCNTNKPARSLGGPLCEPESAGSAWRTCSTNSEPAGSFPRCRSRFGVFDMHGNVAEIMTRLDPDGTVYSQLKGSAFFYVDVARKHNERPPKDATRETYPDHCAHDPRWHVEPMDQAWHVNYHLGFRCCKSVK